MLKLSRKADYGLIALKHLALRGGRRTCSAKEIAEAYGIPQEALAKILQKLARGGLVRSSHGTRGGYLLARDPRGISTLEVIRAIDGPTVFTSCLTDHGTCGQSRRCIVREPLRRVEQGILEVLRTVTVADLSSDAEKRGRPKELYQIRTKPGTIQGATRCL
jgi:Rrf2 family protein